MAGVSIPQGFVAPSDRSVARVLSGALSAVGFDVDDGEASRELLGLERAERVCVILVDGLGALNLAERTGHAPTLRALTARDPLTTITPSTTAAAITALGTGLWPGETAMMGYSLRSPVSGEAFSLIKWDKDNLDPREWQVQATLFESVDATQCAVVQPASFIGSGLTEAALRGAAGVAAETPAERVDAAVSALRSGARCAYVYWGDLDHVGHARGWESEAWTAELETLDASLRSLLARLPRGTEVILTADHGMVDTDERIDISQRPELSAGVQLLAGEDRAIQLYADEPDAVAERWRDALGEGSWVLTKDEAIETGLFGTVSDHSKSVMGDVLAFQFGKRTILDSRFRRPGPGMIGVHGSLTPQEMYVPLVVEMV